MRKSKVVNFHTMIFELGYFRANQINDKLKDLIEKSKSKSSQDFKTLIIKAHEGNIQFDLVNHFVNKMYSYIHFNFEYVGIVE